MVKLNVSIIPFLQGSTGGINIGVTPCDNANSSTTPRYFGGSRICLPCYQMEISWFMIMANGFVENSMNGSFMRTIGLARAKVKIEMINLTYNICRCVQLKLVVAME